MSLAEVDVSAPSRDTQPGAILSPWGTPQARRLLLVLFAVVAVDWGSKAAAWRLLPGRAVINADTSGALPVLPGLVSQPVLGAVIDAAALVLLSVTGLWLSRTPSVDRPAWTGCALIWSGIAANAADRWFGHLLLAPGSQRGVIDWISIDSRGSINLADLAIGIGLVLAIAAVAAARLPRRARVAVALGVALLVPLSVATAGGGTSSNAVSTVAAPTFAQRVRAMMWVGPEYNGRRFVWRDWRESMGWDLSVDAVDAYGRVLAQWYLPSGSRVSILELPTGTSTVLVRLPETGRTMTLAEDLE